MGGRSIPTAGVAIVAMALLPPAAISATAAAPVAAAPTAAEGDGDRDRLAARMDRGCNFAPRPRCGHIRVPLDRHRPASGSIRIAYELFPRRQVNRPLLGTIVAVEGGPGYSSTGSRAYYRDLFGPLLDRRQLLIVDNRGTGKSEAIRCRRLQSYQGDYEQAVGRCGRQLGRRSDLYGTRIAAQDLVAVLDHLGIDEIDLYGDSYGTFFGQTFAVRHPHRLRTLILDAAYFVGGKDPWYTDTNRALRTAFRLACRRSPACADRPGDPMRRIARLARLLRDHPISGRAPNADGVVRRVVVDIDMLIDLVTGAATTPAIYRELDAAARAVLRPHPYARPLLRLARESTYVGGAGPVRWWSEGLYVAVTCNDYPQPYDMRDRPSLRPEQFQRSIRRLQRHRPHVFAPFTVREWVRSPYGYYDDCLRWPAPSRWVHPVPRDADYPDVPTLVLAGDLDSLTSPEGARMTARAFPDATYVEVANMTHVSALVDFDQCASRIVLRFVRTKRAGDTSCARRYHENRLVETFARQATDLGYAGPRRRTARVAAATAADVLARWWSMAGRHGVGLQGGRFFTIGGAFTADRPVARWRLSKVRWVRDVAVSGRMTWNRRTGAVRAHVTVAGPGAVPGRLVLRWDDGRRHPPATVTGRLGGERVDFRFPAP
jgi:pimeloyl-ACP methyl ester carboxylesterase